MTPRSVAPSTAHTQFHPAWHAWALPALATLCLFVGVLSLDRGFAAWRNDARNFPAANGSVPSVAELTDSERARMSEPVRVHRELVTGVALLCTALVLFGVAPFPLRQGSL